eukprot:scaffold22592_cov129-Cylindrotheca_fusiformis.AAC.24
MKRRYPGDHAGSPRPTGPGFSGRSRPHDPRFGGRGGLPSGQRPAPSTNVGFRGRGGLGSNIPGRGGDRHAFQGGQGAHYGSFQDRCQPGRGMSGPPTRGRGTMGRGNTVLSRGPLAGRLSVIGRDPSRPGVPVPNSVIPPPPPRGIAGPPPFQHPPPPPPPPPRIPPVVVRSHPPLVHLRQHSSNTGQPKFQQHQFQHPASLSQNVFSMNNIGRNSANHPSSTGQRLQPVSFSNSGTYSHSSIPSPSVATTPVQNQSTLNQVVTQAGQANARKPTADQIDKAWKEYTHKGVKYYHNPILNESTYTKPITLANKESAASSQVSEKRTWQEYEDPATGKKYYSDGVTTTWEKPSESNDDPNHGGQSEEPESTKKKKKNSKRLLTSFSNKGEAIAAFKGLLLAKGIVPTIKWNEVVKIISSDSRWEACEEALSVGERRQALAEYQTKRANELRDLERQERIRAKDAFCQLLTDVLPTISGFSASSSHFADVRPTLANDDRFHAVATETTRESLFLDFCEELRKRDERNKRNKKREIHDAFVSFLREREEAGKLTFASTWDSFVASLDEDEKNDERFNGSATTTDSDRELFFADFVIELQAAEDDKRRRIRDARRRAEKAQRDAYREVLQNLAADRKISPSTRWRSIEELVFKDDSFNLVAAQDRDSPRSLFEEFVAEWDDNYHRERLFLSRLLPLGDDKVTTGISYDEFKKLLLDEASNSKELYGDIRQIINTEEPVSSARLYYDELMAHLADQSRRGAALHRLTEDSSEDEGEIIEDGDMDGNKNPLEAGDAGEKPQDERTGPTNEVSEGSPIASNENSNEKSERTPRLQDLTSCFTVVTLPEYTGHCTYFERKKVSQLLNLEKNPEKGWRNCGRLWRGADCWPGNPFIH